MIKLRKILIILGAIFVVFYALSIKPTPSKINYGASFSKFHADELGLDWKKVYIALLEDLKVRNFRLSAHWPMIEPEKNEFNFSELDFQMKEAKKRDASVILAVGRRLPGWPECHEPGWLNGGHPIIANNQLQLEVNKFRQEETLKYIQAVVNRYKDYPNLKYWQVENEPFLTFFSRSACGLLDKKFLKTEINFVHKLDPTRQILMTDSGEFGDWLRAYSEGDIFGTSLYLYIWNHKIGPLRYPITPAFFRIKQNITQLFLGKKPSIIIELSTEPWLLQAIKDTPINIQLSRMGVDKFNEMIYFSSKTGFDTIYFWGAEWWYWLKENGYSDHWGKAKEIFKQQ